MAEHHFQNDKISYTLLESGILISEVRDNIIFGMDDFHKTKKLLLENIGSEPRPVLIRVKKIKYTDRETSRASNEELAKLHSAVALLVENTVTRFFFKSFFHIKTPTVPTHFFSDEESALAWLKNYIPQKQESQNSI